MKKSFYITRVVFLSVVSVSCISYVCGDYVAHAVYYPQINFVYSSSRQISASISSNNFSVNVIPKVISTQPISSSTKSDLIFNEWGQTQTTFNLGVIGNLYNPTYRSITPNVVTVDQSGNVSYVNDGFAQINVTVGGLTRGVTSTVSTSNYGESFYGYTPGTLAYALNQPVKTDLSGLSPSNTVQNIYSSTNDSSKTYARNTSLLTQSLDLTGIPAYNSTYGTSFSGMLVAPDILIMANHMPLPNGTTVYFVDNNNNTSSRTITGGMQASTSDIYVARLSSPVSPGITFARVFPNHFDSKYFSPWIASTSMARWGLPFFVTNQFRSIYVDNLIGFATSADQFSQEIFLTQAQFQSYPSWGWGWQVITGDSGSPVFSSINGQTVLIGTWHTTGLSYGSSNVSYYYTSVNSAISTLGSSYQLTPVDMSGFQTY